MRIRMLKVMVTPQADGTPWPAPPAEVEVPTAVGADLINVGMAEAVKQRAPERATARKPEDTTLTTKDVPKRVKKTPPKKRPRATTKKKRR